MLKLTLLTARHRIVNGLRDDYFGNVLDEILDEGGVNTARISLLWDDRVSCLLCISAITNDVLLIYRSLLETHRSLSTS